MSRVEEIETALRELPPQERCEVARWLLEEMKTAAPITAVATSNGGNSPPLPDYSARRRRIFGDKVLPNMVLASRAEESW